METIKYAGEVDEKGKLTVFQKNTFKLDIRAKFAGSPVWVTVEHRSSKTTNSQRGYLMGVVIPRIQQALRREQGLILTPGETRRWVENHYLTETRDSKEGIVDVVKPIAELSKKETSELIETLIFVAATELFEVIPYPNEV